MAPKARNNKDLGEGLDEGQPVGNPSNNAGQPNAGHQPTASIKIHKIKSKLSIYCLLSILMLIFMEDLLTDAPSLFSMFVFVTTCLAFSALAFLRAHSFLSWIIRVGEE